MVNVRHGVRGPWSFVRHQVGAGSVWQQPPNHRSAIKDGVPPLAIALAKGMANGVSWGAKWWEGTSPGGQCGASSHYTWHSKMAALEPQRISHRGRKIPSLLWVSPQHRTRQGPGSTVSSLWLTCMASALTSRPAGSSVCSPSPCALHPLRGPSAPS